jgi:membrane-bound serine protease (ClpP class)
MPDWCLIALLFISGLIFLLIELFVIPGFGFVGIVGIILLGIGCFLLTKMNFWIGLGVTVGSISAVVILTRLFWRTRVFRQISLDTRESKEAGFEVQSREERELVGKKGRAVTPLRPAGIAEINGERKDVVAEEGEYISSETPIKVVKVEGNKIIVAKD